MKQLIQSRSLESSPRSQLGARWVAALVAVGAAGACGKGEATGAGQGGEAPAERPAPKLSSATLTIPPKFDDPEIVVTVELPEGWLQHDFFKDKWVPSAKADPMKVALSFSRTCNGECSAEKLAANIADAKREIVEGVTNPNLGMLGLSAEDSAHFKGTVEVLADETFPSGASLHAIRASYPEAPAGKPRPSVHFDARCYVANADDDRFLVAQVQADRPNEALVWPVFKAMCASLSYKTPAGK